MQPSTNIPVQPGQVIDGKYQICRFLGEGGMGVVVEATHLVLEEKVAIKFLLPAFATNEEVVTRFVREARAAIRIRSEHVARVMDVCPSGAYGPFLVMEYLVGEDLSQLIDSGRTLASKDAVGYVLQVCEALGEAHSQGIIHRDLKPANLFLSTRADGSTCIKILDFGISKVMDSGKTSSLTRTQGMMGSPLYMSPEQAHSARDTTPRSDIWSLGIVLYELLTGKNPLGGETLMELCINLLQHVPTPPSQCVPGIPAGLDAVVMKCIEKDPANRFQNVAELAFALAPFGADGAWESAHVTARVLGVGPTATNSTSQAAPPHPPPANHLDPSEGHVSALAASVQENETAGQRVPPQPSSQTVGSWETQHKPAGLKSPWLTFAIVGSLVAAGLVFGSAFFFLNTNASETTAASSDLDAQPREESPDDLHAKPLEETEAIEPAVIPIEPAEQHDAFAAEAPSTVPSKEKPPVPKSVQHTSQKPTKPGHPPADPTPPKSSSKPSQLPTNDLDVFKDNK